jgi:hypothetical protein
MRFRYDLWNILEIILKDFQSDGKNVLIFIAHKMGQLINWKKTIQGKKE